MAKATDGDRAEDMVTNILTGLPGIGSVYNGAMAVYDGYNVLTEDDPAKKGQSMRDLANDVIGFVPLVGTIEGIAGIGYDAFSSDDTWSNVKNRMMGGPDAYPTYDPSDDHPNQNQSSE